MPKRIYINKQRLISLYLDKKLNSCEVARKLSVSPSLIRKRLREFSIKTRGIQETKSLTAIPKYKRINFKGPPEEKAYLIGFRLGDLYVYKTHPKSPTIIIRNNTTKDEQLGLIRKLFSPYGGVVEYKRDKNGAISIGCFLNNSFSFLLPKNDRIDEWITKSRKSFAAFLAGYIDAEGSFINKHNTALSLQTQDENILKQISVGLNKYGIKCMMPKLNRLAKTVIAGVKSNRDVWIIYIYNKENLLKLIKFVGNLIQHQKRKNDMLALLNKLKYVRAQPLVSNKT